MTQDEKRLLQAEVVTFLATCEREQPTLLLDTLLDGRGPQLIEWVLGSKEHEARKRAEVLGYLLRQFRDALAPPAAEPQQEVS